MQAVLINGAVSLEGLWEGPESSMPLEPPPSFQQGFGRISLNTSLPLQVGLQPCRDRHPSRTSKAARCRHCLTGFRLQTSSTLIVVEVPRKGSAALFHADQPWPVCF